MEVVLRIFNECMIWEASAFGCWNLTLLVLAAERKSSSATNVEGRLKRWCWNTKDRIQMSVRPMYTQYDQSPESAIKSDKTGLVFKSGTARHPQSDTERSLSWLLIKGKNPASQNYVRQRSRCQVENMTNPNDDFDVQKDPTYADSSPEIQIKVLSTLLPYWRRCSNDIINFGKDGVWR